MTTLEVSRLRQGIADAMNTVAYTGQRISIRRHGKPVAVLVSVEDAAVLEALEDSVDMAAAKKALKEKGNIPWAVVRKRLGLKNAIGEKWPTESRSNRPQRMRWPKFPIRIVAHRGENRPLGGQPSTTRHRQTPWKAGWAFTESVSVIIGLSIKFKMPLCSYWSCGSVAAATCTAIFPDLSPAPVAPYWIISAPILMTSFAFIFGVIPLVVAQGASRLSSMAGLCVSLSTLHPPCYHGSRMARGWNGSLILFHAALSSATPCRF